jgi:hypothetical protein
VKIVFAAVALASVFSISACSAPESTGLQRRPSKASATSPGADETAADGSDDVPGGQTPGTGTGTGTDPGTTPKTDPGTGTTVTSSKGTGGATGQNELKSTGGLSYIVNVPAVAPAKPRGLLVLLHGSTASNYRELITMMATVASTHDLIRVSVLAPNGQGWNEGNQTTAAESLHKLIQQDLLPKYDVDLSRVLFSGQSSGGGFLSSYFLPLHAKDYRGGAFLQCGAAPPVPAFAPDAATKQGFRLHFEITTGDTIWPTSYKNAVAAYSTAGMTLTKDDTKPGGHCAFDQQAVIQAHIATILP